MTKSIIRYLCAVLTLVLLGSAAICLAEAERDTVISFYEPLDSLNHIVYTETWEYPIVNGQRASGHPIGEGSYAGQHTFQGGRCVDCGYVEGSPIDLADSFTSVNGVELAVGTPIDTALQAILSSVPANTLATIDGVDAGTADRLIGLARDGDALEEMLKLLPGFPAATISGASCAIVTVIYTEENGSFIAENYAFNAADGTLVAVY